jgi:hypothetical protein
LPGRREPDIGPNNSSMQQTFRNNTTATFLVWVEPWAEGYEVPAASELSLLFELGVDQPSVQIDISSSEAGETCLTVWVSLTVKPVASIDGIPSEPIAD